RPPRGGGRGGQPALLPRGALGAGDRPRRRGEGLLLGGRALRLRRGQPARRGRAYGTGAPRLPGAEPRVGRRVPPRGPRPGGPFEWRAGHPALPSWLLRGVPPGPGREQRGSRVPRAPRALGPLGRHPVLVTRSGSSCRGASGEPFEP